MPILPTTKLPASEVARRLSEGGRRGGHLSAATRRARRQRYEAGEMNTRERADYEQLLAAARASGSKGGQVMSRKFAAIRAEKRAAALANGNDTQEK